ncbi:MAG: hypothetical protein Q7S19_03805 [bacterium]|nr:hypothetical protein [bacterium]
MHILRNIGIAGSVTALLLGATSVLAVERSTSTSKIRPIVEERREAVRAIKEEVKVTKQEAREDIKNNTEKARAKVADVRAKAKERLADIKDKQKQQLATRLAEQIEKANKTWTDHFTDVLNHLNSVLKKVEDRTAKAKAKGADTTSTDTAIASAKTVIVSARAAVSTQAIKTYVADTSTITTTSATSTEKGQGQLMKGLKAAYQTVHKQLFSDLKALRDGLMKDARKAVNDAVATITKIPKAERGNATSTDRANKDN